MDKTAVQMLYDKNTGVEALVFGGIVQPFPQHFHDYYVIGITEGGTRSLTCGGKSYFLQRGAVSVFRPGESHACLDMAPGMFYYKSFNLPVQLTEILLPDNFTGFGGTVFYDIELFKKLSVWHKEFCQNESIAVRSNLLKKVIASLVKTKNNSAILQHIECQQIIKAATNFIISNYNQRLSTKEICRVCGVSASTLLRCFAANGITPKRYITAVRINKACQMLQNGDSITVTALASGFNDQSHFTNNFTKIMGVTPKVYSKVFLQRG